MDSRLQIPPTAKVLRDGNVIIATTGAANRKKMIKLKEKFNIIVFDEESISIPKLLDYLRQKEIISCLVEGGGKVLGSFVDGRLVDKVYAFHAPIIIGGEGAKNAIAGEGVENIKDTLRFKNISYKKFDDNILIIYTHTRYG